MTEQTTERTGEMADLPSFIAGHLNGRTSDAVSAEFHALLDAVREHGKKGTLTLTIVVEPPANGVESAPLPIGIESAVKAPKAVQPKSLYFLDKDGLPVREDPRQMSIPFHSAPTTTEYKDAH